MHVSHGSPVVGFIGVLAQKDAAHCVAHAPALPPELLVEPELVLEPELLLVLLPLLLDVLLLVLLPELLLVDDEPLLLLVLLDVLLPELPLLELLLPASSAKPGVVAVLEQPLA
jgi:hypothetical protein